MNSLHRSATALVGVLALAAGLGACGSDDSGSADDAGGGSGVQTIEVGLSDAGCEPNAIEATAGPTTFHVTNTGSAAVTEFEVLEDGHILGEVENIAVGFDRSFTLTLAEGTYDTLCLNGTNEDGTLTVAPGSQDTAPGAGSELTATAVATYLQYVEQESTLLVDAVQPFVDAVKAGDVETAKSLFGPAREHYESIEPIAESFGDLDPLIDAREGDVPDEEWGGFHEIEQALWVDGDVSQMGPVADELAANIQKLQDLVPTITLEPAQIANGAVDLLNEVSTSKITGEEDRYSHTDLYDFASNLTGARNAYDAVRPLLAATDAELAQTIVDRFDDVQAALDAYKTADGYVSYTDLTEDQTTELATKVDALAEPLSQVAAAIV